MIGELILAVLGVINNFSKEAAMGLCHLFTESLSLVACWGESF